MQTNNARRYIVAGISLLGVAYLFELKRAMKMLDALVSAFGGAP